jgi:transposase-like protein
MRKRRRFTPEFTARVVLEVLAGTQSPAEACRKHALSPNLLGLWKSTFLERAHTLSQPDEQRDLDQARIAELEQRIHSSLGYLTPAEFGQQRISISGSNPWVATCIQ